MKHVGLIAQEVQAVLPEAVSEDREGHMSLAYDSITALLVEAVKEQAAQIKEQAAQIKALQQRISDLEQSVKR
jgi:hypothetical protein